MSSKHYFICKDNPFLVLGPEKWLSTKELVEGSYPIYVFPDTKTAQGVQALLPKTIKQNTSIRNESYMEQGFMLKFTPGVGFVHLEGPSSGPRFSEPFNRESLLKFTLPPRQKESSTTPSVSAAPAQNTESVSQVETDSCVTTKAQMDCNIVGTSLVSVEAGGHDTTNGNLAVKLFEDILAVLEQYVDLKTVVVPKLFGELSLVDKELEDELHFAEFATVNAADGFKSFRRIQGLRRRRRNIKDSGLVAAYLNKLLPDVNLVSLQLAKKQLNGLRSRKYKVRVPETFLHKMDGGTIF